MSLKEAHQIVCGLFLGYVGQDQRVCDVRSFYEALVEALQYAHEQG